MEITNTCFTGRHDLPEGVLAFATIRDGELLFVWNLPLVKQAVIADDWDQVFDTANAMIAETLRGDNPTVMRLVS